MRVADRNGIVLDYTDPETMYDAIVVTRCRPGKAPEKIGTIMRSFNDPTDTVSYQAYNEYFEPMGKAVADLQEVEERFQKHAYDLSRNGVHQAYVRIIERGKELNAIREEKRQAIGRELTR